MKRLQSSIYNVQSAKVPPILMFRGLTIYSNHVQEQQQEVKRGGKQGSAFWAAVLDTGENLTQPVNIKRLSEESRPQDGKSREDFKCQCKWHQPLGSQNHQRGKQDLSRSHPSLLTLINIDPPWSGKQMLPCFSQGPQMGPSQIRTLSPSTKTDLTVIIQEKCCSTFLSQYAQIKLMEW